MKKKLVKVLSAVLAGAITLPIVSSGGLQTITASAAETIDNTVIFDLNKEAVYTRTEEEIKANRSQVLPTNPNAAIYQTIGTNASHSYKESTITETTKKNLLNASNYYRWLAGLNSLNFTDDPQRWEVAAKGAVLLSVSNFDHNPDQPADMSDAFYIAGKQGTSTSSIAKCWGEDQGVLIYTLQLFLNDDGYLIPGHRNTFLTRNAEKLAYGMYTDTNTSDGTGGAYVYSCQTVIVKEGSKVNVKGESDMGNDEAAYAWPAPGSFPAEELSMAAPWTINLNTDKIKFTSDDDIIVKITDTETGTEYIRTTDDGTLETSMYWGVFLNFTAPEVGGENYIGKTFNVDVTGLKDSEGKNAEITYNISFFSYDNLSNESALQNGVSAISIGDTVVIEAGASGGSGRYQYSFRSKKSTDKNWSTVSDYSEEKTYSFKPESMGDYSLKILVKDKEGTVVEKEFKITVNDQFANISRLSAINIDLGQTITLYGEGAGGSGTKTYSFSYKKLEDSDYTVIEDFGDINTVTLTPEQTGYYNIIIQVRDTTSAYYMTIKKQFTVYVYPELVNESVMVNGANSTTFKGAASGGSGDYRYEFLYRAVGAKNWEQVQSANGVSAVISGIPVGSYEACIKAIDSTKSVKEAYYTFKVKPLINKSVCIVLGENIVFRGSAAGGSGTYRYSYYYQEQGSDTWKTIRRYTTSPNAKMSIPEKAGIYRICMKVTDSSNNVSTVYLKLKVTAKGAEIS